MSGNVSKKGWTNEEDQIISEMIQKCSQPKVHWVQVSNAISAKTGRQKTGKQCRQRWQHQLNPKIVRSQFNEAEVATIFQKQSEFGNKWVQIATFLPGRTDNSIKNFFYSSIRRILTTINAYMSENRTRRQFKTIRMFQSDFLSKLMSVVDGNFEKRLRLASPQTEFLAKRVLSSISKLILKHISEIKQQEDQCLDFLILSMQQFRRKCIKRKKVGAFQQVNERQAELEFHLRQRLQIQSPLTNSCSEQPKDKENLSSCFANSSLTFMLQTKELQLIKVQTSTKNQIVLKDYQIDVQKSQLVSKNREDVCFAQKKFSSVIELNQVPRWGISSGEFYFKYDSDNAYEQEQWRQAGEIQAFGIPFVSFEPKGQSYNPARMLEASLTLDELLMRANKTFIDQFPNY